MLLVYTSIAIVTVASTNSSSGQTLFMLVAIILLACPKCVYKSHDYKSQITS